MEATCWLWYSGANQNVGPSVGELHLMWLWEWEGSLTNNYAVLLLWRAYFLIPNHGPNKVSSASLERVKESKRRWKLNKTAVGGEKRAQHKGADRMQTTVPPPDKAGLCHQYTSSLLMHTLHIFKAGLLSLVESSAAASGMRMSCMRYASCIRFVCEV